MSDAWSFFLVLCALYALECFAAIPRASVTFSGARGQARVAGATAGFGSRRFALVFTDPLAPARADLVVPLAPLSLSEEGVLAFAGHAWNPGPRPESSCAFATFEAPFTARAIDGVLVIRGAELLNLGAARAAARWAEWIRRMASERAERRSALLARILTEHLSEREARRRLDVFADRTRALGISGTVLAVFLILGVPAIVAVRGLAASWLWLLAGVLVAHVATVGLAIGARVRLGRECLEIPASRLIPVCLSPVSASRAVNALGRDLVADLHPVAVARVVCPDAGFRDVARRMLSDLKTPIQPMPELSPAAAETEARFRDRLHGGIERLAGRLGDPTTAAAESEASHGDARARCPRCGTRYTTVASACAECGVALEPITR